MPRAKALYAAFERRPPVHWLLARFLGFKPPARRKRGAMSKLDELRDFVAATGGTMPAWAEAKPSAG